MQIRRTLFAAVLVAGLCPLFGATITYTVNGTLNPNQNGGPDCLGLAGQTGTASASISSTAVPFSHTTTSAKYHVAAGKIAVTVGTTTLNNTKPWVMTIHTGAKSSLSLSGPLASPLGTVTAATSSPLAASSFKAAALKHPTKFAPTPQSQTPPTATLTYGGVCASTVLGVTGSISN